MNVLFSLAKNAFREAIRDRILSVIFVFGFLFLLAAPLAGKLAVGQEQRLVANFGISMIHLFGIFLTIFVGSRLIFNEIDKKTIFLLIPKPIPRSSIILGKFFGLGAVLFLTTMLMTGVYFFLVPFSFAILLTVALLYLSFLLLLALVLFLSSFMSPLLSSVAGILLFVVGNTTASLKILSAHFGGEVFQKFSNVIYVIMPNFSSLNLKNYILYDIPYTSLDIFYIVLTAVLFILLFLIFAILIFSRKQFV
ncbi:ABC transporter permease [Candidatus Peregrinibacteria bacterium]|nr:ABC transporter permease [Candidatus Peregrinibacteria bacterium]